MNAMIATWGVQFTSIIERSWILLELGLSMRPSRELLITNLQAFGSNRCAILTRIKKEKSSSFVVRFPC